MSVEEKIESRLDHIQSMMESNYHLGYKEQALELVQSVSKFWSMLDDEQKDYIQVATDYIKEQKEWLV